MCLMIRVRQKSYRIIRLEKNEKTLTFAPHTPTHTQTPHTHSHPNPHPLSGCSSARLEYSSGGRGVESSNLSIPTEKQKR